MSSRWPSTPGSAAATSLLADPAAARVPLGPASANVDAASPAKKMPAADPAARGSFDILSPGKLHQQNAALESEIAEVDAELADVRRQTQRKKQESIADGSELKRVDREIARYRKENAELKRQVESSSGRIDREHELRNMAAELDLEIRDQQIENDALGKVQRRLVRGVDDSGWSDLETAEVERLRKQVKELNQQVRQLAHQAAERGIKRREQQRTYVVLCDKKERLKRAKADDAADVGKQLNAQPSNASLAGSAAMSSGAPSKARSK